MHICFTLQLQLLFCWLTFSKCTEHVTEFVFVFLHNLLHTCFPKLNYIIPLAWCHILCGQWALIKNVIYSKQCAIFLVFLPVNILIQLLNQHSHISKCMLVCCLHLAKLGFQFKQETPQCCLTQREQWS